MARRFAGRFLRYLWLAVALLVILYAIVVVTAREMLPLIHHYQPAINAYLSRQMGMDFHIDRLTGLWRGWTPSVELESVRIAGPDGASEAVFIDQVSAELHPGKSAARRSPVWRSLTAGLIRVNFTEDEQGRWTIAGHPLARQAGGDLDYLYRMLFYSRLLRIDHLELNVRFFSGSEARVIARDIQIENAGDFHRATARLAVDEWAEETASFIFEGRGDPLDGDDFTGQAYLRLKHINIDGSLSTIARAWFPEQVDRMGKVETGLDFELWFDWADNALVNARGTMEASEIPLSWMTDTSAVRNLKADVTGWFQPGEDWGLRLQNLSGEWRDEAFEPLDIQFRQRVGRRWGELELAVSHVNIGTLNDLVLKAELTNSKALEVLGTLNPEGRLRNLAASLDFSGEKPQFLLRANLEDVSVDSWRGAPAARGVSGYVEAELHRGFVALDCPQNLALRYPQAYGDFMPYSCPRGKVAWEWRPEQHRVLVTSNVLKIQGEEGQGRAFLHLDLPARKGEFDPQMFLMVGLKNSHSRYMNRYLPNVLDDRLLAWLEDAVGDGEVVEGGFIWRGSLLKQNSGGRSIQLYARVRDGELDYQPGWPPLTEISGMLVVNNTSLDGWVDAARAGSAEVTAGGVTLRPSAEGPVLSVSADARSTVENALKVLADSPLSKTLGRLSTLEADGQGDISLDLRIPLRNAAKGADYQVTADVRDASLVIPNTAFRISAIQGQLAYDRDRGLRSDNLNGTFLGGDIGAEIRSRDSRSENRVTEISITASPSAKALGEYLGSSAARLKGKADVTGVLTIPFGGNPRAPELELTSTLEGLAIDLPAPFGKGAKEKANLASRAVFADDHLHIQGAVEDRAALDLAFEGGDFVRGEIRLLASRAELPREKGLLISGSLERLDWKDWQATAAERTEEDSDFFAALSPRLDLRLGHVVFGDFDLGSTHLTGNTEGGDWLFAIEAAQVGGRVAFPGGQQDVLTLDLDYLKLPESKKPGPGEEDGNAPADEADPLDHLKPSDVPDMDFSVATLSRGEKPLGNLAFKARKIPDGVLFRDITGTLRGIEIRPQPGVEKGDPEEPAEMRWTLVEERHNTFFSGALLMKDFEEVMAAWDIPAPLKSKSSAFFAEIGWNDQPWDYSLLALDGYLGLELKDGQFYKATGAATNTLFKLVSLINFDTWLRRLRFDFSDIFTGGVSFDKVQGGLLFRQGLMDFDDPIVASMPSGKIRLLGTADLVYEQLDAKLVATMPVGTNLPWVAGLLGGLPAAAGVYLTSKIFEKQVDRLSSLSYTIKGSFDDPDIEVDKIFTDPTKISPDKMSAEESDKNLDVEPEKK